MSTEKFVTYERINELVGKIHSADSALEAKITSEIE
jgi:hypothetical protein